MSGFQYIDNSWQLEAFVAGLAGQKRIAIDTEFVRERTYYPILCLIQVAGHFDPGDGAVIALIDPMAIDDLTSLGRLLGDTRITKVLHAGRQDIEVLLARTGSMPKPVFDTQIGAALLGHGSQVSYAALVETLLGVRLNKAHTRTDWARRPLRSEQLTYAAADVRYLFELEARLAEELNLRGRAGWAAAELDGLADEKLYRSAPGEAWRRLKGLPGLEAPAHAVARSLAAWRERQAMSDDRPRQWILRDAALLQLARSAPRAEAELAGIADLSGGFARRHGAELVGLISDAREDPAGEAESWPRPRLDAGQKALLSRLAGEVRACAEQHLLSPELLATRSDLERLVRGDNDPAVLQGWRLELIGERLREIVNGNGNPGKL
ncbi:MAG: ribonuclease D [Gammaproteobacteria bacterium]|nr:ribonuclease D [Gammaproteobacteria bacterium]